MPSEFFPLVSLLRKGANGTAAPDTEGSAVVVTKLDFTYDGMDKPVLRKFDLDLPKGSRCDWENRVGRHGA